jgi:hypothetical protein
MSGGFNPFANVNTHGRKKKVTYSKYYPSQGLVVIHRQNLAYGHYAAELL